MDNIIIKNSPIKGPYRFSPIESKEQLREAVHYTHIQCFKLCKKNFGRYLPAAGNIGIFCHYDDEFNFLTTLRKELTIESDNWNNKYYRLHTPIIFPTESGIPETAYTYLYVRKPDQHEEVGDADFVLDTKEYTELKSSLSSGITMCGIEILNRPDLDLIKLFDPHIDVLSFIVTEYIAGNVK